MDRVFKKLGYEFVNASNGDDWDILWSKEHPYYYHRIYPFNETKLEPHQKINHFPGNNFLVGKSKMSILNNGSRYILPAFRNENMEELRNYIKANPHKQFVKKSIHNRGVKIVEANEINENVTETFYQVFLDNPFLIDGHAFDFGVFVLITSIDPLRIYRYDEEVLLRFCPKKYHPFNKTDTKKYVVADDHLPTYKMKIFNETYKNYKTSFKILFEDYIKDRGHSVDRLWKQIDDAIATIILNSSTNIKNKVGIYDLD
ncbi:probable tubulin polyglutamylase ttll-15 [Chironomus tepperi]|uniref:probable tubulin polyglutamylase ttll-15 n=1 Tax=Chironomus tepperi TaxID=113505 RepID=UPI00391F3FD0